MLNDRMKFLITFSSSVMSTDMATVVLRELTGLANEVEKKISLADRQILLWSLDFRDAGARITVELCERGLIPDFVSSGSGSHGGDNFIKLADSGLATNGEDFILDFKGKKGVDFVVRKIVADLKRHIK